MAKNKFLSTKIVCACCGAGSLVASLGCMAIMITAVTTTSAIAMGSMGAMSANQLNFPSVLLSYIGLGFLTKTNLKVLESILVVLLLVGIGSTYLSYRYHKKPFPLILSVISSILVYVSIFILFSNIIYYASLIGLIVATVLNLNIKQNGIRK